MHVSLIDIIFAVVILVLIIRASLRGFVDEFMSMAALVLGLLAAALLYKNAGIFIPERYMRGVGLIPELLGFLGLFLIVFVAIKVFSRILQDIIQRIHLGGVDRFLGFVFGIVEGLTLITLILLILVSQPLFNPAPLLGNSYFARFLLPLINRAALGAAGV